jgi:hypothetical protein
MERLSPLELLAIVSSLREQEEESVGPSLHRDILALSGLSRDMNLIVKVNIFHLMCFLHNFCGSFVEAFAHFFLMLFMGIFLCAFVSSVRCYMDPNPSKRLWAAYQGIGTNPKLIPAAEGYNNLACLPLGITSASRVSLERDLSSNQDPPTTSGISYTLSRTVYRWCSILMMDQFSVH